MNEEFDKLPWHDASLHGIWIDRTNPGISDTVVLNIEWCDGTKNKIVFNECYLFKATMNFGVVAEESIYCMKISNDSEEILDIKRSWEALSVDLSDLYCYEIVTNSTGSNIVVCAKSFDLEECS